MANTQQISRHVKSVKSTKQITKAMELVAASKMRRAQDSAEASRAYAVLANQILARISEMTEANTHPLYKIRPIKHRLYIAITSDRGLAGAYNSNILKYFTSELQKDKSNGIASQAILVGKKAGNFAARISGLDIIAAYDHLGDRPDSNALRPILETALEKFKASEADAVDIIYTNHKSSILQITSMQRILPANISEALVSERNDSAFIEPSISVVLEKVTERLVEAQLHQAMLESIASEQSARMLAMKTATDNAAELIEDLTLASNKARQSAITQELAEISGGVEALK